jgi:hypothetical protein
MCILMMLLLLLLLLLLPFCHPGCDRAPGQHCHQVGLQP